jgi:phosphoribosylamine--glycine ligase
MKVLLIGNGAREHAIFKALQRSAHNPEIIVFAKAKNPGMLSASAYELGDIEDMKQIQEVAQKYNPDFAFVGPDNPISFGAADTLAELSIPSVAPMKTVARLEGEKSFTRDLLKKHNIAGNPLFNVFTTESDQEIQNYIEQELGGDYVVKYDGLLGGKGVKVSGEHLANVEEGVQFARECIAELGRVVIEEKLIGPEFSLMSFVDGKNQIAMPAIQDHKRAFNGDTGPNTGGMGTYSDADHKLPFITDQDIQEAKAITQQTLQALHKETETEYKGIMYGGFMKTKNGVRLIEYNARFGDPEAMNALGLLDSDFVEICQAVIDGTLDKLDVKFKPLASVCLYVVPEGYPKVQLDEDEKVIQVAKTNIEADLCFASVDLQQETDTHYILKMSGSRALAFTGFAPTIEQALEIAKQGLKTVEGKIAYRTDIGTKELIQKRIDLVNSL